MTGDQAVTSTAPDLRFLNPAVTPHPTGALLVLVLDAALEPVSTGSEVGARVGVHQLPTSLTQLVEQSDGGAGAGCESMHGFGRGEADELRVGAGDRAHQHVLPLLGGHAGNVELTTDTFEGQTDAGALRSVEGGR